MEEDIKIVEDLKNKWELNAFGDMVNILSLNEIKALENLIKGYREKEEIVKQLDKQMFEFSNEVARDYIPKSKIRVNIEELNKEYKEIEAKYTEEELDNGEESLDDYIEMQKIQKADNILQELLEEEV